MKTTYTWNLYLPLDGKVLKPKEMSDGEWGILDRKALRAIRLSLAWMVAFNVSREKTALDLMTDLSEIYEKLSFSNRVFLMKKLLYLKMADIESVAEHLNEFNKLTSQLESVEINFDDKIRTLDLLSTKDL